VNDNIHAQNPHHAECLRLLNDLHDLFTWAEAMGIQINSENNSFKYAMDFSFWRGEIGEVLAVGGQRKRA
jgi:hypothetical protein